MRRECRVREGRNTGQGYQRQGGQSPYQSRTWTRTPYQGQAQRYAPNSYAEATGSAPQQQVAPRAQAPAEGPPPAFMTMFRAMQDTLTSIQQAMATRPGPSQ